MNLLLIKCFAALALLAALLFGFNKFLDYQQGVGDARATARYEAALTKQKADASKALDDARISVAATEKKLNDFKNNQEVRDAAANKTNLDQAARLRELAGPTARLRDPYAPSGCRGCRDDTEGEAAAASNAGAVHAAEAGGLLSEPLSRLLVRLTSEADAVSAAYASCRADAYAIRAP